MSSPYNAIKRIDLELLDRMAMSVTIEDVDYPLVEEGAVKVGMVYNEIDFDWPKYRSLMEAKIRYNKALAMLSERNRIKNSSSPE